LQVARGNCSVEGVFRGVTLTHISLSSVDYCAVVIISDFFILCISTKSFEVKNEKIHDNELRHVFTTQLINRPIRSR